MQTYRLLSNPFCIFVVFIWIEISISGYIEPYPKSSVVLGYNNIDTPHVVYQFRFRLSHAVFPNQYLIIKFPRRNMPDLQKLEDCLIRQIPQNNSGNLINPVLAFKDQVNVVETKFRGNQGNNGS